MQDETIVYSPGAGKFCVLNETAAFIWEYLEDEKTVAEITDGICASFEGAEPAVVNADVEETLANLVDLAIVSTVSVQ